MSAIGGASLLYSGAGATSGTIKAEIVGTTFKAYLDSVEQYSCSSVSFPTGLRVGMGMGTIEGTAAYCNDWSFSG